MKATITILFALFVLVVSGCLNKNKRYDVEVVGPSYHFQSYPVTNSATTNSSRLKQRSIREVLDTHQRELLAKPGVIGLYVGKAQPSITLMLLKEDPQLERSLPRTLEGYPLLIDVIGEIKPLKQ